MTSAESFLLGLIANAAWQVPAVALVAWTCAKGAGRASAAARHAIWLLALGAAVLLPVWSARTAMPRTTAAFVTPSVPSPAAAKVAPSPARPISGAAPRPAWRPRLTLAPAVGRALLGAYAFIVLLRLDKLVLS